MNRRLLVCILSVLLFGCELKNHSSEPAPGMIEWTNAKGEKYYKKDLAQKTVTGKNAEHETVSVPTQQSLPSEFVVIKGKPTWDFRSFINWRKTVCDTNGLCYPMGRATILVEFDHLGCRIHKQVIDDQAALVRGYAPQHQFVFIFAASDALTRELFDYAKSHKAPCRVFLYDDTLKMDKTFPNEDQWFVELCKDITSSLDSECRSQLLDKRLYTP